MLSFSALQRAEIAEINAEEYVSVSHQVSFSALQRAEIAEINYEIITFVGSEMFQCSSTSRNC